MQFLLSLRVCCLDRMYLSVCLPCRFIPMSYLQFYRATKSQVRHVVSRNFSTVAQLVFLNRAALYVQLCREDAVNADWPILVYATKLQCATYIRNCILQLCRAIKLRDKIAGVTSVLLAVTHQGAACDTASVHFCPTVRRTDILVKFICIDINSEAVPVWAILFRSQSDDLYLRRLVWSWYRAR